MLSNTSLTDTLAQQFPEFSFVASDEFRWSPDSQTVTYDRASDDLAALLHELSHAILGHKDYKRDIELIGLERDAWRYASEKLAKAYRVTVSPDEIEDSLDTYRDWLHARSTCPRCQATGIQVKKHEYKCPACFQKWRVNDARVCALRRYKLPQ